MNKKVKDELYNVFDNMISSDYNDVAKKIKNNKGVVLNMEKKSKSKYFVTGGFGLAFAVMLFFVGLMYFKNDNSVAVIGIDVNPSLELSINSKNKVVSVNTNNEDGKKVLGDMDLKGSNVDVAVNAIFGSMVKNGYINENDNSVLISMVEGSYDVDKLANNVYSYLKNENLESSILTQNLDTTSYDKDLSKKYNISVSRVKLIRSILNKNSLYNFEELSKLSTNELNILANTTYNKTEEVSTVGTASKSNYISIDDAKKIVFDDSKVSSDTVKNLEIEYDYDDGIMVYDIEFISNNTEYDYEIDAKTGKIIEREVESKKVSTSTSKNYLSKEKIKEIVLNKTKVKDYYDYEIEFEFKSGKAVYEVEFETKDKEYDIELDAVSGNIIKYETKNKKVDATKYITKEKAKTIVLNDAKVTDYFDYEIEFESDDETYEISFDTKDTEYEYVIDAKTGKIIEREVDRD